MPLAATRPIADAILDRLVHNAHRIDLAGNLRRRRLLAAAIEQAAVALRERAAALDDLA
jgi:hypothetical protein